VRILYLEDEADIAEAVVELLEHDHYTVIWVTSAAAAFDALAEAPVDLALLDVMIGSDERAGFHVAAAIREAGFGGSILFLSARDAVGDRVEGLDLGADDYLVKPFSVAELRARVRALLRRGASLTGTVLERGALRLDLVARTVSLAGDRVEVSEREFAMLELFAHDPERVVPVTELLDRLFPHATSGPAVVRVYVRNLRKKLGEQVVVTAAGGYRLGSP